MVGKKGLPAINIDSLVKDTVTVTGGEVGTYKFANNNYRPNIMHIINLLGSSLYISRTPNVSDTDYDIQVVTQGIQVWTVPAGIGEFYFYSAASGTFKFDSYIQDEMYASDLHRTQETVITNSTTTSAITAADGGIVTLGTKADVASVDSTATKTAMAFIKGLISQGVTSLANWVTLLAKLPAALTAGGNLKTALLEAIPAGTNIVGKFVIVDETGAEMDLFKSGDNFAIGGDHGLMVLMTDDGTPQKYRPQLCNSSGHQYVEIKASSPEQRKPTTVVDYNVTCTNADTEYSQALPAGTKKVSISFQDGSSSDNFRVSFITNKVGTPTAPYKKYPQSIEYSAVDIYLATGTLYFASSVAGKVAQIECWT